MTTATAVAMTPGAPSLTACDTRLGHPSAVGPFAGQVASPPAGSALAEIRPLRSFEVGVPPAATLHAAGIDLTDVARIAAALHRTGPALIHRLCGAGEQRMLAAGPRHLLPWGLSLAFGLKESVVKAVGGFPAGGLFTDIDTAALLGLAWTAGRPGSDLEGPVAVHGVTGQALAAMVPTGASGMAGGARRVGTSLLLCWALGVEAPA